MDIDLYIDTPYKSEEDEEIIKNELNIWAFWIIYLCQHNKFLLYLSTRANIDNGNGSATA